MVLVTNKNKTYALVFVFFLIVITIVIIVAKAPIGQVNAIYIDEYGRQWLGTDKGLLVKNRDSYEAFYTNPDVPGTVTDIKPQNTPKGTVLWVGTTKGLSRFEYSQEAVSVAKFFGKKKTNFDSEVINSIVFDKNSTGIFATPSDVGILIKNVWQSFNELPDIYDNHFTSVNAKGDTIYVGTTSEGVGRLVNSVDGYTGASNLVRPWSSLVSNNITCIFIDSKGNRWFGTDKGLSRHSKNEAKQGWDFSLTDKLPDRHITCLTEDRLGNLWIGTKGGLVVLNPSLEIIATYSKANGMPSNAINTVVVARDSSIWAGTDTGVTHIKDATISNIRISNYLKNFIKLLNIKH